MNADERGSDRRRQRWAKPNAEVPRIFLIRVYQRSSAVEIFSLVERKGLADIA
jgi:hypothetical protein